jgi:cation:H+ antiporter
MLVSVLLFVSSFIVIWIGSGFIIQSINSVAKNIRITPFALSFFILGFLTSIPEIAVGMTAIAHNDAPIFVGNLVGGIPVIFLLVIPTLALFGNGIKLTHTLSKKALGYTLSVIAFPALLSLDGNVTNIEGVFLILLYLSLYLVIQVSDATKVRHKKQHRHFSFAKFSKLMFGAVLVFVSGQIIVDKTILFSQVLHLSPFIISVVALSLGTNLPELSLAIRSVMSGKNEIALGDYLGSAAANTFLFGLFTLMVSGEVVPSRDFIKTFIFMLIGLGSFYAFTVYNKQFTRGKALFLLAVYVIFVLTLLHQ